MRSTRIILLAGFVLSAAALPKYDSSYTDSGDMTDMSSADDSSYYAAADDSTTGVDASYADGGMTVPSYDTVFDSYDGGSDASASSMSDSASSSSSSSGDDTVHYYDDSNANGVPDILEENTYSDTYTTTTTAGAGTGGNDDTYTYAADDSSNQINDLVEKARKLRKRVADWDDSSYPMSSPSSSYDSSYDSSSSYPDMSMNAGTGGYGYDTTGAAAGYSTPYDTTTSAAGYDTGYGSTTGGAGAGGAMDYGSGMGGYGGTSSAPMDYTGSGSGGDYMYAPAAQGGYYDDGSSVGSYH